MLFLFTCPCSSVDVVNKLRLISRELSGNGKAAGGRI